MDSSTSIDALVVQDLGRHKLPARHLVAALRQAGWRAQLVDLNDGADAIIALARRTMPRLVISSILFADRVDEHFALMTSLRDVIPRAHLAMAGHLPALASVDFLTACPALDAVLGDDKNSALSFLRLDRPSLDDLPFPARDDGIASYQGYGFAAVEASRGCYHACSFCLPSAFHRARGAPYRLRSIPNLVDEIESLYRRGARLFLFDDEQFLPPPSQRAQRIASLADELERRDLRIAFTFKCRADDVDAQLFRRLQALGLLRVYVGVESGNPATLDLYNKRVTVQQNVEALATLSDLGVVADFRAVLLHPWSAFEAIETEIAFLDHVLPWMSTAFDFRELEIYHGTPLARRLQPNHSFARIEYTIGDARAELLRQLCRGVFDPSGAYGALHRSLTEAWFAQLVAQRFQPSTTDAERARELKSQATKLNGESLAVWREMLAFARDADTHDANRVNEKASAWVARINQATRFP